MQRAHSLTRFPLRGAHESAECEACHLPTSSGQAQFVAKSTQCVSCHLADFRKTTSPRHEGATFSTDCASCHTIASWMGAKFDHEKTLFPLTGGHIGQTCAACHGDRVFKGKSLECISCHRADYDKVLTPRHAGGFPTGCTLCHTTASWKGAKFNHDVDTRFVLTGAHRPATCAACHGDLVFKGKSQECASCHQKDYDGTTDPKHAAAGFATTCADCHTTTTYKGAQYDHDKTRFPLTGNHRAATCSSCHADNLFRGKAMECASCHQRNFQATTRPPHAAAGFALTCEGCHRSTTTWLGATFDHGTTRFPLTNGHAAATCTDCHADGVYRGKPLTCVTCHQGDATQTTNPHHVPAHFSTLCESCHNTTSFTGAKYDHNLTAFPLKGSHLGQTCLACHADQVYKGRSVACVSCHQDRYNATTNPNHRANSFPTSCESCHNTVEWRGAFDHSKTRFPLNGGHQAAVCADCHADGVYKGRSMVCASCHQQDFDVTSAPKHSAAGFPNTCEACHTTVQWKGALFDHSQTAFPLAGGHLAASCIDCHANGLYNGTPTACQSCHQTDFNSATNPHHVSAGFTTLCTSCHTTSPGWKPTSWDHTKNTTWPLSGAHVAQACLACHTDKVYAGKPSTCVSCHLTDYNNTISPKHATVGYSSDCVSCHTTTQWKGASFDHSKTAFPLTGGHLSASCIDCHATGVYKGTPTACASCHQPDFNTSTNPHHVQAAFIALCASCHTTNPGWKPTPWNHNTLTAFALTGAHVSQTCLACHGDKVYKGKSMLCISCHQADWNTTTKPPHGTSGFPPTCETCHSTVQWLGATFDHSTTAFPLTGGHLAAVCGDCHLSGVYKGTPTACVACHTTDFNSSTNPHHVQAGFATLCTSCHTTTPGWKPTSWSHAAKTAWPLTGAHLAQTCLACHSDKVYKGKSNVCVSCHLADYNSATNPNHKTAGFPTDCAACHTTTMWQGATFNHDQLYFPIYSGKHKGKWTTCADCHVNSSNYAVFECILCHKHSNKAQVDNDHQGKAPGYVYQSSACYACHPLGRSN
jgi:hypothetical protein